MRRRTTAKAARTVCKLAWKMHIALFLPAKIRRKGIEESGDIILRTYITPPSPKSPPKPIYLVTM